MGKVFPGKGKLYKELRKTCSLKTLQGKERDNWKNFWEEFIVPNKINTHAT